MNVPAKALDRTIAALLFVAVAAFALHKIVAYDVWWQLEAGRWVLERGWPATDPFSYGLPGRPWVEMRWLYCVAARLLFDAFGLNALILAKTALVLAAFACLWRTRPESPVWARSLAVACALAVAHLRFTVRPELVTFLLLAFTFLALSRYRAGGHRNWILALPVVQLLWTNSHTLFILGPVTIWIFAVAEWAAAAPALRRFFDRKRLLPAARLKPLFAVAAASTVACFASPYFVRGALFPFQLFTQIQSGHALGEIIGEFKSPFEYAGLSVYFLRYPVVVGVSALGFALNRRRLSPGLLAVWGAFLYLSTLSERNLALFGFAAGWAVVASYGEWAEAAAARGRAAIPWGARAACAALALVAIPAVATNFYYRGIDPARRFGFGVAENRFPIKALAFVRQEGLAGPVLCNLGDGGYTLFERGERSVYVDGRLEVYTPEFVSRADALFRTGEGFAEVADRHGIGTVAVAYGLDGNLFRVLNRGDAWAPVYFDETHAIFSRLAPETRARVEALRVDWRAPARRDAAVPPALAPPDWLGGLWPKVSENVASASLGQLALLTGNLELAHERFSEAHRARPDDRDARLSLGVVSRALGRDDEAARLLAPLADGRQVTTAAAAAAAFEAAGSLEAAIATCEAAIARGDRAPENYVVLSRAAAALGRTDLAAGAWRRLTEAHPGVAEHWVGRGVFATRRNAFDEAIAAFERALEIDPRQPAVHTAVGVAHLQRGRTDEARAAFERALAVDPGFAQARQHLARMEQGRR